MAKPTLMYTYFDYAEPFWRVVCECGWVEVRFSRRRLGEIANAHVRATHTDRIDAALTAEGA